LPYPRITRFPEAPNIATEHGPHHLDEALTTTEPSPTAEQLTTLPTGSLEAPTRDIDTTCPRNGAHFTTCCRLFTFGWRVGFGQEPGVSGSRARP
jgi:hypothetical protein